MRDDSTAEQACDSQGDATGALLVQDSIFFDVGPDGMIYAENHDSTAASPCQTTDLFAQWQADNGVRTNDPGLPEACANPFCQPIPTGDVSSSFNCSTLDAYLMDTGYIGAFAPGQPSWATGNWVNFATE
jgi:hypothetical protein